NRGFTENVSDAISRVDHRNIDPDPGELCNRRGQSRPCHLRAHVSQNDLSGRLNARYFQSGRWSAPSTGAAEAERTDLQPVRSPDGSRIAFQSNRKGIQNLYWKSSSGAEADELLLESDQVKAPNDWSSDGRFLLFRSVDPLTSRALWVLPVFGDKKP